MSQSWKTCFVKCYKPAISSPRVVVSTCMNNYGINDDDVKT